MAAIYLRHPKHGAKVACSDLEALYDEQNGWDRYDPSEPRDEAPEPVLAAPTPNALRPTRKRKDPELGAV